MFVIAYATETLHFEKVKIRLWYYFHSKTLLVCLQLEKFSTFQRPIKDFIIVVKENHNQLSTKINKIAYFCNFSRFSFFKLCLKEAVVAAAFMFELNIFQIFEPRDEQFAI